MQDLPILKLIKKSMSLLTENYFIKMIIGWINLQKALGTV